MLKHIIGKKLNKIWKIRFYLSMLAVLIIWPFEDSKAMHDIRIDYRLHDEFRSDERPCNIYRDSVFASTKVPYTMKRREDKLLKVTRDGDFILHDNGIVYDEKTGLEWVAGPDRNTNWYEARRWVENLSLAGSGWRMPSRIELKGLYEKGKGSRNMTPLLKTTGWCVWSGETRGSSSAWSFPFTEGFELWRSRDSEAGRRSFAVRSRRQ